MADPEKQLMYHVHQFLREKNLLQTLRSLETESGIYLDVSHVEDLIQNGAWDQLHKYLTGFFNYGDDRATMEISFQIKKQKFFEALKKDDHAGAVAILFEEGNTFREYYQEKLNALLLLVIADDPWNDNLSVGYKDEVTSRDRLSKWIKGTFQMHSGLRGKMQLPDIKDSELSVASKQSPKILCETKSSDVGSSSGILIKHRHGSVEAPGSVLLSATSRDIFPIVELPKVNVSVISLPGMVVNCFDFNPKQDDMLVGGTASGSIFCKKIGSSRWYWSQNFRVWNPLQFYSKEFQSVIVNGAANFVTCVRWSTGGHYLGVGFSRHLLQLWSFKVSVGFKAMIEIEAHTRSVNDIVFYTRNENLRIVTCGEDGLVKIWDARNPQKPFITLEGHATSVESVSFHQKEEAGFVFLADKEGKMKVWEVDAPGNEYDFDSHGCLIKNLSSKWGDGASLFTSEADTHFLPSITEWHVGDKNRSVTCKRRFIGLGTIPNRQLTFDNNGKILVAGNQHCLKFWDVNFADCLWTTRASHELQDAPFIRLSKSGLYLAVLALDKSVKIFGNLAGLKLAYDNALASGEPMPPSTAAQYRMSARAFGLDNLTETAQPLMPTFNLSIGRASNAELRGHPRMLTSHAVPKLLNADSSPATTRMLNASAAPYVSTAGASNPGLLASHVASSSSAHKDKHKLT